MIKISRNSFFLVLSVFVLLAASSCQQPGPKKEAVTAGPAGDAFPSAKAVIKYAHGFSIAYYDHYKVVRLLDHDGNRTDTLKYLLVQEGTATPSGYPGAQVITIPVKSLVVMSSMHVAIAEFAGVADRIKGLGSFAYLSSPMVRNNVKAGKVTQIGLDGNINNELVISMHPGLLMSMANPDVGFAKFKTIMDAGVPVMPNSEWLETTPLGRAEWVKLMAALVNKEDFVNKKFDSVARAYETLAQLGSGAATRPRVIIGMPFKGSWYVPAGGSYMAKFLHDAGAGYKWADSKGIGSLALDFEAVAPEALTADYWLNLAQVDSKKEIAGKDPRYTSFKSFKTGGIYNNTRQVNETGANDYWESGAVNPQVVLADMIRILHPELLPDHHLVYYKQLQ
jgi:iron complex transport system substrate-binding protein